MIVIYSKCKINQIIKKYIWYYLENYKKFFESKL